MKIHFGGYAAASGVIGGFACALISFIITMKRIAVFNTLFIEIIKPQKFRNALERILLRNTQPEIPVRGTVKSLIEISKFIMQ